MVAAGLTVAAGTAALLAAESAFFRAFHGWTGNGDQVTVGHAFRTHEGVGHALLASLTQQQTQLAGQNWDWELHFERAAEIGGAEAGDKIAARHRDVP